MGDTWIDFWKQKNPFDNAMGMNFQFFLEKVEKHVTLNANTIVLDVGSGPGYLEDAWCNRVGEMHAMDISEKYNEMVRQKHRGHANVYVYDLAADDYTNLSALGEKKFNLVVVIGVLQYYKSKDEVKKLLLEIKKRMLPGGRLVLADIVLESSFWSEVMHFLKDAIRSRKFFSMMSLFVRLQFSPYRKVRNTSGFLVLAQEEWKQMFDELQLNAKQTEPITLHSTRKSYIVQF